MCVLQAWLQLGGSHLVALTRGGPQGEPPAEAEAEEAAAAEAAAGNPVASETLGEPWGGARGLLWPTKPQPLLVGLLGPKCTACLLGALRLALMMKDLELPTLPLPRKPAEARFGRFRGGGMGGVEHKIERLSLYMVALLGSARVRFCRTERQRKPRGLHWTQVIQGMLHVHLHLAALEPPVQDLQHMCLHLPRSYMVLCRMPLATLHQGHCKRSPC